MSDGTNNRYVVEIEGQKIPVPDEIGSDDAKVKQALAPFYPDAANAMITRTEKDGVTMVNVVKRAGTKGWKPVGTLQACAGGMNPAVALYLEFAGTNPFAADPEQLLALNTRLRDAIRVGNEMGDQMQRSLKRLQAARTIPAPALVEGF
jgi:hypothetical protein